MAPKPRNFDFDTAAISRRLKVIRQHVSGNNQSAFARRLGIGQPRWNNFEKGYPINLSICGMLIKEVEGLSIDWIIYGVPYNMPRGLQDQLAFLEERLAPPAKPRKSKRKR